MGSSIALQPVCHCDHNKRNAAVVTKLPIPSLNLLQHPKMIFGDFLESSKNGCRNFSCARQ